MYVCMHQRAHIVLSFRTPVTNLHANTRILDVGQHAISREPTHLQGTMCSQQGTQRLGGLLVGACVPAHNRAADIMHVMLPGRCASVAARTQTTGGEKQRNHV